MPVLSSLTVALWLLTALAPASAHEIRPAIADVVIGTQKIEATISLNGEGILAGVDLGDVFDTDQDINAEDYDLLRALSDTDLARQFMEAWPQIRQQIIVQVGEDILLLDLDNIQITPEPNFELPRDTVVSVSAALPVGETPVVFGWVEQYGPLIVREIITGPDAESAYTGYLIPGALSEPIQRRQAVQPWSVGAFVTSVVGGFRAIVPKGPEHILFVLGLFFFSTRWRFLALQIVAFTGAQTIAFVAAKLGLTVIPAPALAPLVAASIVYVAVDNIFARGESRFRLPVVFVFGLVHGFALAGAFPDVVFFQDPAGVIGLIVGIDLGLLAVIAVAYLLAGIWFGSKDWYRDFIAVPASILIALFGVWWFVERTFLG